MSVEAAHLSIHRLGRHVLRRVSLTIDDGEVVSIIGPNGAGKSTLMAGLLGLLSATEGEVRLDGVGIERIPRRQVARRIAYVPQVHEGYLGFPVREVVVSGRYAHLGPLDPLAEQDRKAVTAAVTATRIEDLLNRTVDTLSGGERQKVWLAAALAQGASMLFLDEPTNALDPAHQAELIRIMRGFAAAGNTLLVVCHDLNLPLALGGRAVGLKAGKVFFDAQVDVLLDTTRLGELFETKFILHQGKDGRPSIHLNL
ncbi:MAG: hypothetical protein AMXMBFR13_13550 [Phycisphaerae bacterium]